ncbi:Transmembrane protein fend, partial [Pseudolycoriella hygida]
QCTAKIGSIDSDHSNLAIQTIQQQCQNICLQKHTIGATTCRLTPVCSKCWNSCTKSIGYPKPWPLRIATMVKQEFLVATHVAWEPSSMLVNCLVTWEVYGGGLMGNLVTDTSSVELSLWPDTKYCVEVTCANKVTGELMKSLKIIVDTSNAIEMKPQADRPTNIHVPKSSSGVSASNDQSTELTSDENKYHPRQFSVYFTIPNNSWKLKYPYLKQCILGSVAALIVFLFVLTIFLASRKRLCDIKAEKYLREMKINIDR